MCPGHERWHPNPGFYYLDGGGPMLDMGPYYVTDLVNLLGPVASVSGTCDPDAVRAHRDEPAHGRNAHSGRGRDACHRDAVVRLRRRGLDDHEFRRSAAQARPDRALWRERLAASFPTRIISAARSSSPRPTRTGARSRPVTPTRTAITASSASPTWRMRSAPAGRTARAARWRSTRSKSWRRSRRLRTRAGR